MRVGSVFTGIGGFDIAFEQEGFEIAWQVENDRGCRKLLQNRFPGIRCFGDISGIGTQEVMDTEADAVDVMVGGFP